MIHALSVDLEEWYHSDLLIPLVRPEERISQVREAMSASGTKSSPKK